MGDTDVMNGCITVIINKCEGYGIYALVNSFLLGKQFINLNTVKDIWCILSSLYLFYLFIDIVLSRYSKK